MTKIVWRKFMTIPFPAYLSLAGTAFGIVMYVRAFLARERIEPALVLIILSLVAVVSLGLLVIIKIDQEVDVSFWSWFASQKPKWSMILLAAMLAMVFSEVLLYYRLDLPGVPSIVDGQYVIEQRGKIIERLDYEEFVQISNHLVRVVIACLTGALLIPATYWWMPPLLIEKRKAD